MSHLSSTLCVVLGLIKSQNITLGYQESLCGGMPSTVLAAQQNADFTFCCQFPSTAQTQNSEHFMPLQVGQHITGKKLYCDYFDKCDCDSHSKWAPQFSFSQSKKMVGI